MPADNGNFLFINGKVQCFDALNSHVEAMLVLKGKIRATGSYQELRLLWDTMYAHLEKNLQEVDLEQKWIYPGFIDAHLHPITNIIQNLCKLPRFHIFFRI
ncbi:MAG: hypothetical protein E4G98_06945 [Promethearchaeota archaeon]|nr:MAG: hypothetical protein E4G98_06945 [Candidatus Lokiarchaeota archaeon]